VVIVTRTASAEPPVLSETATGAEPGPIHSRRAAQIGG
jgi:hypothetical protein